MKIIDARSGEVMVPGKVVRYSDGEWLRLDKVEGVFSPKATTTYCYRDLNSGNLVTVTHTGPLTVRWGTHPSFLGERVGFIQR